MMRAMLLAAVVGNVQSAPIGEYVCAGAHATIQCMADARGSLALRMHAVFIDQGRQYVVVGCAR